MKLWQSQPCWKLDKLIVVELENEHYRFDRRSVEGVGSELFGGFEVRELQGNHFHNYSIIHV